MNRTANVVRMQFVNRNVFIWIPLIVLVGAFAVSLMIYGIISSAGAAGPYYGGGAQAPLWTLLAVGIQALTLSFPFSQAMSVTRKEFYLGTLLSAAVTSAVLAVVFVIGGLIEKATGGWWLNGYFFHLPWIWENGPAAAALVYFSIAMLFFVMGFWGATIFKRWGITVLTIVLVALGLLLVAALWLVARANAWVQIGTWFVAQGALGLALWGLALIVVLAGFSYWTLRRAVP
ncbi:hypothetical protein [Propionimicrobium sp. PCR01-08-3]|uniref:hypothetical protein n=1 Tax=Propionimicrobium sp. PCR01-08-3 TaxID=3052086 RepID=UPI00255C8A65|nr:hypothetical protein [Propionimicrobium sp. PCR01-08-3]WIY84015.1 hypothetical protein QQ658_06675 [Propionimicrobium sp. PCR01-08-3]